MRFTGHWKKLHSQELHDLYRSPYIISDDHVKEDEMSGQVAYVGRKRNAYEYLVGNLKEINHL